MPVLSRHVARERASKRSQRPANVATMKNAPANQLWRFAQKSGFGEQR
jgi:hypothetical protein